MTTSTDQRRGTTSRYLIFVGIDAPLLLNASETLIDLIGEVTAGWPFVVSHIQPDPPPFFTIDVAESDGRYHCQDMTTGGAKRRTLDPVNAVCDLVAAMSRALPASEQSLICLHAAAIEVSGRLVVIPNTRRAGKSTLTAYLAHLGYPIFTDDFVAVSFDRHGTLTGRANGICPRLRLPLPDTLPTGFKRWALGNPGPSNKQYKYLSLDGIPANGTSLPLGAIVLIDREKDTKAELREMPPEDAMKALLRQNFTRDVHSAAVLSVMERLMATLPVMQLRYADAQDAAACITGTFGTWTTPPATSETHAAMAFDRAAAVEPLLGAIQSKAEYSQKPGTAIATIGETIYLSDPKGAGIHRLDAISRAIWLLLDYPTTPDRIIDILQLVFPEVATADIRKDTERFLNDLARAGLIVGQAD